MLHALLSLADFTLTPALVVPIVVPVAVFIFVGAIVITRLYFRNQQRRMWHETARLALEKGQPLPPDFVAPPEAQPEKNGRRRCDVRAGLILIAVGVALYLAWKHSGMDISFYAAIPGFIGVALLLNSLFDALRSGKSSARDDQSGPK